jgi:hypothetical protein
MMTQAKKIAELRLLVGYLGEQQASLWWGSKFFASTTPQFLAPIFNRTLLLAQYHGVCAAAARRHDESIGVGRTFHLYRLPEIEEQGAAAYVASPDHEAELKGMISSPSTALAHLQRMSTSFKPQGVGPVSLGTMSDSWEESLSQMAACYAVAMERGETTYPYLREAV